jgi:hypothetical protein
MEGARRRFDLKPGRGKVGFWQFYFMTVYPSSPGEGCRFR